MKKEVAGRESSANSMHGKVSVIIGCYNGGQHICETIDSILNQTYENIELILVNDGSTDNTLELMKSYEKDERVKVFDQENGGPSSARDLGYQNAEGDYIFFIDADDILIKDSMEKLVKLMAENEDCDAVPGFARLVESEKVLEAAEDEHSKRMPYPELEDIKVVNGRTAMVYANKTVEEVTLSSLWGILFRREFFEKLYSKCVGFKDKFHAHYMDDALVNTVLYTSDARIIIAPFTIMIYRIGLNSVSHKLHNTEYGRCWMYTCELNLQNIIDAGYEEFYSDYVKSLYFILIRTYVLNKYYEDNVSRRAVCFKEMKRLSDDNWESFKKYKPKGLVDNVLIRLWKMNPNLCGFLVKTIRGW